MKSLLKKAFFSILLVMALLIPSKAAFADKKINVDEVTPSGSTSVTTESKNNNIVATSCRYLLGMVSWDCNLKQNVGSEDDLTYNIWQIAANILSDITIAVAYLVVGFVIYGGYLYIFSGGDPSKVTSGKKTLVRAFAGLAIVVFANIIINIIRAVLGANLSERCNLNLDLSQGSTTLVGSCATITDTATVVTNLIQWVIGISGVIAVIFVVMGGISYITSSGDPGKVKKAKDMILYAIIGLAIVGLAEIIVSVASSIIRENAGKEQTAQTSLVQNITKEGEII